MPRTTLWIALALTWTTHARAADEPAAEVVADGTVPVDIERDPDGIWAWTRRLDGEVVQPEQQEAIDEAVEVEMQGRALVEELDGLDIPSDYYNNPERTLLGDPLFLDQINPREFDIPVTVNDAVETWMRALLGPQRKYTQRWLERRSKFEPMILAALDQAHLPHDLLYLSMIESGFNPNAYSSADAAGLWQFIPDTGRMYGLRVDYWIDERRDPELATGAALHMLGDLYKQFGDWQLAFAAYNTGPGRIARGVARLAAGGEKADFWTLYERDMLHPETEGYVPKILAAAIIGKHPERYGFTNLQPMPKLEYDSATVDGVVDVAVIAKCAGISEDAFRELNPMIRRYATPDGSTTVRLPKGTHDTFVAALAAVPPAERRQLVVHAVARGETLSMIAGRYGVTAQVVQDANRISNPNRIAVGQKLVIPVRGAHAADVIAAAHPEPESRAVAQHSEGSAERAEPVRQEAPASKPEPSSSRPATYTVRSGDSLGAIADRFDMSLADLQALNDIRDPSRIAAGQVLKVSGSASGGSSSASASSSSSSAPQTYKVRSGDSLSAIATRYGVSVSDLQSWNGIRNPSDLRAGQTLKIQGGSSRGSSSSSSSSGDSVITYTVRSGDSLGIIAERYHVSVDQLRAWNGIRGSSIFAGDRLKIHVKK